MTLQRSRTWYKLKELQMKTDNPGEWSPTRILVVDDDVELCELVDQYLRSQGFQVDAVHDGATGIASALSGSYAMVILDVMLPGIRGFEALRQIRAKSSVPVIMLTAHGEDVDRIVGLEIGADDYLAKPFNPRELVARIRAILRRGRGAVAPEDAELRFGRLQIDRGSRMVRIDGEEKILMSYQFDLLVALASNAGRVLNRERL